MDTHPTAVGLHGRVVVLMKDGKRFYTNFSNFVYDVNGHILAVKAEDGSMFNYDVVAAIIKRDIIEE